MKRLKFHRAIVAIAMMLIGWLPSLAHDFEVDGIYYNLLGNSEIEVTYDDYYPNKYSGEILIPQTVSYGGATYIVTSIGDGAFYDCHSLTSVVIGNSVISIGKRAFLNCTGLISIKIPNSVTSIGEDAFRECSSLTSIEIPNSVTSIGNYAFHECTSLTRIICTATTPPTIESDTFSEYSAFLFVPIGCKATYEVADYWENFNNIIEVTLEKPITLNDNDAIVATIGENIVVKNATAGSVVRVYTTDGAMIASEVATEGDVVVKVPVKGIYVVVVEGKSFKVMVK